VWRCGGSCTSGRPTCSQSVVQPGANAAAGGVAEMVIVWRSAVRQAPQCSALAAASDYCWLGSVQHSVAVVQPRQYPAARQCCWTAFDPVSVILTLQYTRPNLSQSIHLTSLNPNNSWSFVFFSYRITTYPSDHILILVAYNFMLCSTGQVLLPANVHGGM